MAQIADEVHVVFSNQAAVGGDGTLAAPTYTTADINSGVSSEDATTDPTTGQITLTIPSAVDRPGVLYWQAYRVNCFDNPSPPCYIAGPVSEVGLQPPPLQISFGGVHRFRIGHPTVQFTVYCNVACHGRVSMRVTVDNRGRSIRQGSLEFADTAFSLRAGYGEDFYLPYRKGAQRQLRRLVQRYGEVVIEVTAAGTGDGTGQTARAAVTLAITRNPRIYFPSQCVGSGSYRPASVVIACGDGNLYVTGIQWQSWGGSTAIGHGLAHANDCMPSCVAGHFHVYAIALRLHQAQYCNATGQVEYTLLDYWYPAPPDPSFHGTDDNNFPCGG